MTWLVEHLDDPDVRVVEIDVNATTYDTGHIEGAVLWDIYTDLKDAEYPLVEPSQIQGLIERSGIDEHTTVVFYGYGPALGLWLLTLFRHDLVYLLDTHRDTWCSATDLARRYGALDLSPEHEIIPYCTIGGRVATAWFVLTYLLGHEGTRVYDGSWAEWGRTPSAPVEG